MHLSNLVTPIPRNRREHPSPRQQPLAQQPMLMSSTGSAMSSPSPVRGGTRAPPPSRESSIRRDSLSFAQDDISGLTTPPMSTATLSPGAAIIADEQHQVPRVMQTFEQLSNGYGQLLHEEPTPLARLLSNKSPIPLAATTSKENQATTTAAARSNYQLPGIPRVLSPSQPNQSPYQNERNSGQDEDSPGQAKISDVKNILLQMQQQQHQHQQQQRKLKQKSKKHHHHHNNGNNLEVQWTPTNHHQPPTNNGKDAPTKSSGQRRHSDTSRLLAAAATSHLSQSWLMSIVEATVANMPHHHKNGGGGSEESQLAKLLLRAEEEEDNPPVLTVENALQAAIQDMMSLQNTLLATECQLKDAQQQLIDQCSTAVPSTVGSSSGDQDATTLEEEETTTADYDDDATENPPPDDATERKLRRDLAACQNELQVLQAQRSKLTANMRQKKTALAAATAANQDLQKQLTTAVREKEASQAQLASVHAGLQKVSAVRDDVKAKLRLKQEVLKEIRGQKELAERRLRLTQNERALERKLLELYRELANHTGYHKWGKQLRMVEAELAAAMTAADQETSSSSHHQY